MIRERIKSAETLFMLYTDIIKAGVKVNALPELSTAVINHRINADSGVGELQRQMTEVLAPMAKKFGLSFSSFGKDVSVLSESKGTIMLSEAYHSA